MGSGGSKATCRLHYAFVIGNLPLASCGPSSTKQFFPSVAIVFLKTWHTIFQYNILALKSRYQLAHSFSLWFVDEIAFELL